MSDPSPAEAPVPSNAPSSESPPPEPPASGGRSRALIFVVTFLVTTFVLLTAFQFLSQTIWMQRYLFTVASHTTTALDWITESSYLEFQEEDDLPLPQRGQIRAEIEAWQQGQEAPELPPEARDEGPPLTRWEWFQHRTLREVRDTEEERAIIESLAANSRPDAFDNPEHHIAFLTERADILERAIHRPVSGGGTRERADREAVQAYREARAALDGITREPFVLTEDSFRVLLAIDESLETAWQLQLIFAQKRLEHLALFVENSGPMVHVVWSSGTVGALEQAHTRLTRVSTDPNLPSSERVRTAEEVRADIRALEQRLEEQRAAEVPAETLHGRRFRFTVIPECGAIETMAIYIAAILGFPTLWWKRLAGIALGIPLLYAVNIFRLACLGLIGAWFQDDRIFDFAHHYVWQAIYLVFVVVVWLLWMELLVRRGEKPSHADA